MRRATEALRALSQRERVLTGVGAFHLALGLVLVVLVPLDPRTVTGVDPWLKPIKFTLSITVYLWTLALLLPLLRGPRWAIGLVRWGASLAMLAEIAFITLQAARGTTSHYNVATPFDAAVFSTMGLFILFNTLLGVLLLVLFSFAARPIEPVLLWSIRLGLVLFLAGSGVGQAMIANGAHAVGAPDGGPGLPFVNWSLEAGDLRAAHLVGLHALQALPLLGLGLARGFAGRPAGLQLAALAVGAAAYASVFFYTYRQAQAGVPLLAS